MTLPWLLVVRQTYRKSLLSLALAAMCMLGSQPGAAGTDWGKAVANSTMARFPNARSIPWRYPRALFLFGQYQLYLRTGNEIYLNYLKTWADSHVDAAGTCRAILKLTMLSLSPSSRHLHWLTGNQPPRRRTAARHGPIRR